MIAVYSTQAFSSAIRAPHYCRALYHGCARALGIISLLLIPLLFQRDVILDFFDASEGDAVRYILLGPQHQRRRDDVVTVTLVDIVESLSQLLLLGNIFKELKLDGVALTQLKAGNRQVPDGFTYRTAQIQPVDLFINIAGVKK